MLHFCRSLAAREGQVVADPGPSHSGAGHKLNASLEIG